ncbi:MAG: hypothetical protein RLO50_02250 [Azospirillaceae bacterium]
MGQRVRRRIIWPRLIVAAIPAAAIAIAVRFLLLEDASPILGGAVVGAIIGVVLAPLGAWYTYPDPGNGAPSENRR